MKYIKTYETQQTPSDVLDLFTDRIQSVILDDYELRVERTKGSYKLIITDNNKVIGRLYIQDIENQDSKDYKDKFFLSPCYMRECDWKDEDFYIILVKDVDFHWHIDGTGDVIWPKGDSFTVMKNGKIKNPAGWGHNYKSKDSNAKGIDNFDDIDFMTAEEFYNKNPELCEKLYWFICDELDSKKYGDWYGVMLKNYKRVLETAPELEHFKNALKYNL